MGVSDFSIDSLSPTSGRGGDCGRTIQEMHVARQSNNCVCQERGGPAGSATKIVNNGGGEREFPDSSKQGQVLLQWRRHAG
jgi:hypothetical protein